MQTQGKAKILRIFISSTDKFRHAPLYEVIVYAAKRYDMAGATVLNGSMGFGSSHVVHSRKFWEVSEKLPMVVEIVDEAEKIDRFSEKILLPYFDKVRTGCMITVEDTDILLHKKGRKKNLL